MKRLLLILCCVAPLGACSEEEKRPATAKAPERYGLDWQLFGDVESLTINIYDATTKFGEVVTELDGATFYQFNAAGDVTECVIDCEDDTLDESFKYEYNSDGKISRMVESTTCIDIDNYGYTTTTADDVTTYRYNAEGLCSQSILTYSHGESIKTTFKYDDKDRETEWRSYDSDGALDEVCKKEYDSKGNIIRQTYYNNDGSEKSCATYKYDKRGKCIELISEYDYWCKRYTYRYNSQGLMTAQRVYDGDDEYALESEFRLKYNAAGALIEAQRISYDNLDTDVYDYKITIDKHNNITRIDSYENGDIISVTEVDIVYR